jgi:hypothetical protein
MDRNQAEEFVRTLAGRSGASAEQSDIDNLVGKNPEDVDQFKNDLTKQYGQRGSNDTSYRPYDSQTSNPDQQRANAQADQNRGSNPSSGNNVSAGQQVVQSWSQGGGADASSGFLQELLARQKAADAERVAAQQAEAARQAELRKRGDELYGQLQTKASQSLAVDRNDPIIRAQADAFSANGTRSMRDHLADVAESAGPTANLLGEQRLAAERLGQSTGGFEAELMGRELSARRAEIADTLKTMSGLLTNEQQMGLQKELALMDDAIKQQSLTADAALQSRGLDLQETGLNNNFWLGNRGLDVQSQLGNRNIDTDMRRIMLQNDQFNNDLGLRAEDRSAYWDAVRRGLL